jgi:hypothetical protein
MEPENNMYGAYIDLAKYDPLTTVLPSSGNGLWSQITTSGSTYNTPIDPLEDKLIEMEKKMNALDLKYSLLKLKMLGIQGIFTQEEIINVRKMLMSEDEASRTLADSIIENA